MCGDYRDNRKSRSPTWGSPPHVRGLPGPVVGHLDVLGITPACAGTTPLASASASAREDHPRMCGDYVDFCGLSTGGAGSPPHVRGLLVDGVDDHGDVGITPACAGTTDTGFPGTPPDWDHPRMCGDYWI